VDSVVIGAQHNDDVTREQMEKDINEHVVRAIVPASLLDDDTKYYVNATGRFVIGGPVSDTGFTGRKILVDTYGGLARHGGGAFSGKDPSKVDRSATYAARYIAKNLVAAGLAERLEIQISYVIGVAHPLSISVETFGTGKVSSEVLVDLIRKHFDLRPEAIIRNLDLRRPIYLPTAAYGHFGRDDLNLPWEKTDKAEFLRKEALGK
jgi:S-adenosylmethionine synthetase